MAKKQQDGNEHISVARALNLPISTKHSVELSHQLRYIGTIRARQYLEEVIALKKPVPFRRFNKDVGHKRGMAAGRFPKKAAKEFLKLVKSVEANAQMKGLNASSLKIIKILANKAAIPATGGRQRHGTKRTHLEIAVKESIEKKKDGKKKEKKEKKEENKAAAGVQVKAVNNKNIQPAVSTGKTKTDTKIEINTKTDKSGTESAGDGGKQ